MTNTETTTRNDLLTQALKLFVSHGYDAVGVQQVVDAVGVTKPTLYHYFGSKQGLLEALLAEPMTDFALAVKAAAIYRHDLTMNLRAVAQVVFSFARDQPGLMRLHLSLWFAPPESEAYRTVRRHHEHLYSHLETLFREAAKDHGNMKGRHRAYAATFIGMLNNYAALALNGDAKLDDTLVLASVHQFMHGVFS